MKCLLGIISFLFAKFSWACCFPENNFYFIIQSFYFLVFWLVKNSILFNIEMFLHVHNSPSFPKTLSAIAREVWLEKPSWIHAAVTSSKAASKSPIFSKARARRNKAFAYLGFNSNAFVQSAFTALYFFCKFTIIMHKN